ncbi:MAG: protoheme IX farnesyltransferase [Chloroflexi bacterium RBG_16_50_11]|nr:MAG: protoheme IX farnesyltransferase [Chloroflexi bacterium RBG_16_50_11]
MAQRSGVVYPRKAAGFPFPATTGSLAAYWRITKPTMVMLLVFTGMVGFVVASQGTFPARTFSFMLLSLAFSCAGANTLTCYLDRDIDAVMQRTRHRPIPAMKISPGKALIFGVLLVALSIVCAVSLNLLTAVIILAGVINNVVMYSLWAKRRTWMNIFIGSIAGGLPALAGYAAYANNLDLRSGLLAGIVIAWIPVHIWSIAFKHREDYARAGVPMLPVLVGREKMVRIIALVTILMVAISLVPAGLALFGPFYLYGAIILGIIILLLSFWLVYRPTERSAWLVFKASNIYLGLLFLTILIEYMISA